MDTNEVKVVAEDVKDKVEETAEKAAEETEGAGEKLGDFAKDAVGAIGGFLGKAGEAVKDTAEKVVKKDLDGDGKIG